MFDDVSTAAIVGTGALVAGLQLCYMAAVFSLATHRRCGVSLGFRRPDVISVLFSSVHKSLTLGVPVLKIVFKDAPLLPLLSLPLLMYHPVQIVLGGLAAPSLKTWVMAAGETGTQNSAPLAGGVGEPGALLPLYK